MIDDKKKNLDDISAFLAKYFPQIQFIGIEYLGSREYAPSDVSEEDFKKFWQELASKAKILSP